MQTYAVYLKPRGALAGEIHSDTLFGAICWAIRMLYGASYLEEMLTDFGKHPKFVLSSAFPYGYRDGVKVRFYPKPLLPDLTSEQVKQLAREKVSRPRREDPLAEKREIVEVVGKAKRIKAAVYISEHIFEEIVKGQTDTQALLRRFMDGRGTVRKDIEWVGNALITTGERKEIDPDGEYDAFWQMTDVQRNETDRVAGATAEGRLFFSQGTVFRRGTAGLWFLVRTEDLDLVKSALRYLGDTGIGGDRTVGKGHFEIEVEGEELKVPEAGDGNASVVLSRYIPSEEECDFTKGTFCSYTLTALCPKHEARLPGIGHHTYKTLLRMFEPGSILPITGKKEVYGQIVPVGTSAEAGGWQVWHSGMAVLALMKIGGRG